MKRKRILEQHSIDYSTGEIKESKSIYVSKNEETFTMVRTTQGMDWLVKIDTLVELQLVHLLTEMSNTQSGVTVITPMERDKISQLLQIKPRTIYNTMSTLIKKGFLKRVGYMNYMVNPSYFFKGSSSSVKDKIELYNKIGEQEENGTDN